MTGNITCPNREEEAPTSYSGIELGRGGEE